ncbi:uncharacterized protein LOC143177879 [Calliopsis andreniformis]|uniref:uncharacterized protein LOC143177879 n=1 Tax=Calliopsis andreniformis TaxID=337506 RepID=UPI003FCDA698
MNSFNSSDISHLEKCSDHDKIVHKRRSSVFHSRTVALDKDKEEEVDINADTGCMSKMPEEECFGLEEYVNSLRKERKEWIETYKRRKLERKSLMKQKLRLEEQGQCLDLSILSDSDKAFVLACPNYQHLYENTRKLSEMVLKISVLSQVVYKLNQRFILQMERRLGKVTKKVIETSES